MNIKFEEWARDWYQGIEGGNPDALLWICGIILRLIFGECNVRHFRTARSGH
jgi:hypothetical protein